MRIGFGSIAAALALTLLPAASAIPQARPAPSTRSPTASPTTPAPATTAPTPVPLLTARIVHRYPHDPAAFTEGLIWRDGALYESIGLEGRSEVRRVRLADGTVERRATIPANQFGEGLAAWGDQLISLTWHAGIAHRWAAATLKPAATMRYAGEGWGLTASTDSLIRSDGSATLTFHDPQTMAVRRRIGVTVNGRALREVNELEWVDDAILANVWHQPVLVRIDPADGNVTAVIDLRPIVAEVAATDPEAVANGIAWDPKARRLFVTGKLWPTLFEIAIGK